MKVHHALLGLEQGRVLQGPETVHVDITNACNTNCITCWDHSPLLRLGRSSAWKRQRLDLPSFERLLDDLGSLGGLKAIILSGMGEPFTHPAIYEMIAAVKARGLHLTIITNLVAAATDRILELGVDQLLIGIHAATERAYRAFHPSFERDEWPRLLSMLGQLRASGRRFKHVHVICEPNAHELVEMIRLAGLYGAAQVNFKLASLQQGTEVCRITEPQRARLLGELVDEATALARELGVVHNLEVFAEQLRVGGDSTAPIEKVGCFVGQTYARILVDGTVLYCCSTEVKVGSLAESSFAELWNGPAWNALRARLRRGEYFDSCRQCGKLNQNVKLRARFVEAFGEPRARAVTGAS